MQFFWIYIAAIILAGFIMMGADKQKAIKSKSRISERALFAVAWLGGSPGVFLGICAFRHKTKQKRFTVGLPFIMAAQAVLILFFCIFVI